MKSIVTGASGFLGGTLCRALKGRGHEVTELNSKNCNLFEPKSLDAFSDTKYDRIYHLAAWTQAGDFCLKHPGEQWVNNQLINTHVLQWWSGYQPQAKLIFMGTSCAYAPDSGLREAEYMLGEPIDSLYTYAMTKRMLYQGARALSRQFGLRYLCAVPSTLYGPDYHTDGRQMHFIFDLIRKILRGQEFGDKVELWGNGHQAREIVHVDDFVRLLLALDETVENDIINIGAGEEFSIRHFAERISSIAGYDPLRIAYDETRYVGAKSKCLDITKLRSLVGDPGFMPLDRGLRSVIEWFRESRVHTHAAGSAG